MATTILSFPTREEPGEYGTDTPIHCADCNAQWDAEEDDGIEFERLNGEAFCSRRSFGGERSCYSKAAEAAYRKEAAQALARAIDNAIEELDALATEYQVEMDGYDDPRAELEDLKDHRLPLYAQGKDTGYRSPTL